MTQPTSVVIPIYEGVTQLDFTGPHQFLSRTPDLHVRVASLGGQTVTADRLTFSNLEELGAIESCDVLLVPGGGGCLAAIENDLFVKEIARLGATARYLTSVCTGSLILGAAGFLAGRRAACHWAWRELLPIFGAVVDEGRIVRGGNILGPAEGSRLASTSCWRLSRSCADLARRRWSNSAWNMRLNRPSTPGP
jgi:cyclohexyl-isocyanide hydratase